MKIGLIGYGYWGAGFVARNIARVADLAVIVDQVPSQQEAASAEWNKWGTRVASEPEVAFKTCDAVWIATPASEHATLVSHALAEGCHVMCEKPFVMRYDEAEELAGEAEDSGLVLMVGHLSLYTRHHEVIRRELFDDWNRRGEMPTVNIKARRNTTRSSISDQSVLWGLGPHDVASVIDLVGAPDEVVCVGNSHRVDVTMVNGLGVSAIELDWLAQERHREFSVKSGGEWIKHPDFGISEEKVEPLLKEAKAFVDMCGPNRSAERKRHRELATSVTSALQAAEISLKAEMVA